MLAPRQPTEAGMRVKLFVGNGLDGIMAVESDINQWLSEQADVIVKYTHIAACSVSDGPDSEQYQSVVFSLWYEGGGE
jgi:hypothetical protein